MLFPHSQDPVPTWSARRGRSFISEPLLTSRGSHSAPLQGSGWRNSSRLASSRKDFGSDLSSLSLESASPPEAPLQSIGYTADLDQHSRTCNAPCNSTCTPPISVCAHNQRQEDFFRETLVSVVLCRLSLYAVTPWSSPAASPRPPQPPPARPLAQLPREPRSLHSRSSTFSSASGCSPYTVRSCAACTPSRASLRSAQNCGPMRGQSSNGTGT